MLEAQRRKRLVGDFLHTFGKDENPDRYAVGKPGAKRLGRYARQRNPVDAARQAQHKARPWQACVARERMEGGREKGVRLRLAPQGKDRAWSGEQRAGFSEKMKRLVRAAAYEFFHGRRLIKEQHGFKRLSHAGFH